MKFSEWSSKRAELKIQADVAYKVFKSAEEDLNSFYLSTIGVAPGGIATLEATSEMISKIVEMKLEDK